MWKVWVNGYGRCFPGTEVVRKILCDCVRVKRRPVVGLKYWCDVIYMVVNYTQ